MTEENKNIEFEEAYEKLCESYVEKVIRNSEEDFNKYIEEQGNKPRELPNVELHDEIYHRLCRELKDIKELGELLEYNWFRQWRLNVYLEFFKNMDALDENDEVMGYEFSDDYFTDVFKNDDIDKEVIKKLKSKYKTRSAELCEKMYALNSNSDEIKKLKSEMYRIFYTNLEAIDRLRISYIENRLTKKIREYYQNLNNAITEKAE